ncbi:MAG TPA: peptidoglycan synthetase [Bacteroides sp.]|nr:peptidoglycan synthetase [Bacteroides sp.]
MRVHFIAIGGAVMHNLALALKQKGYKVTGSDDEIFEPSRSRLYSAGLLPEKNGWDPEMITSDIDVVILGMHARDGNPELEKARELERVPGSGLKIQSFPEFLYEQTADKKRIVIGGSHGKTTITSMVMHVLKSNGIQFDYMVGSIVEGFDTMVGLSEESEIAVFEGDEYLTSALDRRPKFHLYKPHVSLISGIAWDHMNVFPEEEDYLEQFRIFIEKTEVGGSLVYCAEDPILQNLIKSSGRILDYIPYREHRFENISDKTQLIFNGDKYPVNVFGRHNMQNISAARTICELLGINHADFYTSIASFTGAARRMQLLQENDETAVYLDFAHAPSKVMATTTAMKDQYPERHLVAVLELHTFSSLNAEFLPRYEASMECADTAIVYYNPKTVAHKKLPKISVRQIAEAFNKQGLDVYSDADKLMQDLRGFSWTGSNLLIMTSGNFDGQDMQSLASSIIDQ